MTLERQCALHCVEAGKKWECLLISRTLVSAAALEHLPMQWGTSPIPETMGNLVYSVLLDVEDTVAELGVRSVSVHSPNQSFWSVQD